MALHEWFRRAAVMACLLAAAGCPNRSENGSALPAGSGSVGPVGASHPANAAPRRQGTSVSSAPPKAEPSLALDAMGLTIHGQRVDLDSPDAERRLNGIVQRASAGHATIRVLATRDSRLRWIRSLVRALGASGALAVHVSAPTAGAPGATETLALSPLGQIPAHEDHCGVRATISTTHAVELQSAKKKSVVLPSPEGGDSDMAKALTETRDRMKDCKSTVWMLTGEQDATWGDAFDIGVAVVRANTGATTYVTVL